MHLQPLFTDNTARCTVSFSLFLLMITQNKHTRTHPELSLRITGGLHEHKGYAFGFILTQLLHSEVPPAERFLHGRPVCDAVLK